MPNSPHHVFFGIGDGVPNADYYDKVACGLVLDFVIDEGRAYVRLCHPSTTSRVNWDRNVVEVAPAGSFDSGRHRFRMWKAGNSVGFEVDANFEEPVHKQFASRPIDLSLAIPPLLDATNSRLLIGTGNCDTVTVRFEELSVAYSKTSKEQAAGPPASRVPAAHTASVKGGATTNNHPTPK